MKEIVFLTVLLLLVLFVSSAAIFFVFQNTEALTVNLFGYSVEGAPSGVVIVASFFAGVVFMWAFVIVLYLTILSRLRRELKLLRQEKEELESKLKTYLRNTDKEIPDVKKTT